MHGKPVRICTIHARVYYLLQETHNWWVRDWTLAQETATRCAWRPAHNQIPDIGVKHGRCWSTGYWFSYLMYVFHKEVARCMISPHGSESSSVGTCGQVTRSPLSARRRRALPQNKIIILLIDPVELAPFSSTGWRLFRGSWTPLLPYGACCPSGACIRASSIFLNLVS